MEPTPNPIPQPNFTGAEAGSVDLDTAAEWTAQYRVQNPNQTRAHFFGRNIIEKILDQPGCVGLRIYYALDANNEQHLVIVGADANRDDQLPTSPSQPTTNPGVFDDLAPDTANKRPVIAEMSIPCPNQCSKPNPLNGIGLAPTPN